MNRYYDSDNEFQDRHEPVEREREISLGTTMILGIFFVLALLCAVFFGFGYSMGRRSVQPGVNSSETASPTASSDSSGSKPAPGSLSNRGVAPVRATAGLNAGTGDVAAPAETTSSSSGGMKSAAASTRPDTYTLPMSNSGVKSVAMPRPAAVGTTPAPVAMPGMGSAVVQIAAVSHQEDADMLVSALKKQGYNVAIRHEPQDKLLHVQMGPYATKKDAEAMRQHLQADGYNAIVK